MTCVFGLAAIAGLAVDHSRVIPRRRLYVAYFVLGESRMEYAMRHGSAATAV
jgi:hypothetical protein